ncbi:hypothetical protein KAF25_001236 [Fusarium avenaceum]|uniref:DNA-binding protein RAP1 n=1 Tax=Fusarium avenaceum TaxID=40199 RepID=A0A9P7KW13_9HYPO|nr:hypothetical protein KAF25_001236 [Fusarium avenaceum]
MAPTVTYNGVEASEGGTIFKDCKFWIAQRVPQRSRWIDLVRQNGGTVVPLEKQADMLIADYVRKDVPPGSYSWQFIEDSINNGIIQLKDRYLIGRHPDEPRPVGSGQLSRSTRTKFSAEDDANIAKWALEHPTEQKGNRIWQEYERINPRHTAQSWRDRYVKKLLLLGRNDLERLAAQAKDETRPVENTAAQPEEQRPAVRKTTQKATMQQPPAEQNANPTKPSPLNKAPQHKRPVLPSQNVGEDLQSQPRPPATLEDTNDSGKQTFYNDLSEYINVTNADIKIHHTISGRTIELWDLARATESLNSESQLLDWYRVAEDLGFDDPGDDTVGELVSCYAQNLRQFLEMVQGFDDKEEAFEPQDAAHDTEPSHDINFEDGQDSGLPQSYVPSSPPIDAVKNLKRSASRHPLSSSGQLNKRRRYHKDMEIPSTPEPQLVPELPRTHEPSLGALESSQWPDYVGGSEASQHLPPLPIQYESQDLGTRTIPRQDLRHQSVDLAPIPTREIMDSTPIPLHLNRPRQEILPTSRRKELHIEASRRPRDSSFEDQTAPRRAVSSTKPSSTTIAKRAVRRSLPASFNSGRNSTPQRSHPRASDKSNTREIQKWTSHYESMGFSRHIVVEALKRTTLTPGNLALTAMQHLKDGRGIPTRYEGIWTDRDDADLEFVSSIDFDNPPTSESEERQQERAQKAHNRLIKKHGFERFKLRKAFLDAQTTEGGYDMEA